MRAPQFDSLTVEYQGYLIVLENKFTAKNKYSYGFEHFLWAKYQVELFSALQTMFQGKGVTPVMNVQEVDMVRFQTSNAPHVVHYRATYDFQEAHSTTVMEIILKDLVETFINDHDPRQYQ